MLMAAGRHRIAMKVFIFSAKNQMVIGDMKTIERFETFFLSFFETGSCYVV
jgi:hypothetical protein